jgi:hypothetical protein
MGGACGKYGCRRGAHRVLVGKLEGKRPLGRPEGRLEFHIKMGFKVIGSQGINVYDLDGDGDGRLFSTWQ